MLRGEHARAARYGNPLSLIILDIDHFKSINDHYGHTIGDLVLIAVAQLVQDNIRASDLVARWGGEEFAVVAPDSPLSAAAGLAEKLRVVLASTSLLDDIRVTGSFGTAQLGADEDLESLVRRADQALYRAKASGRNRVERS
jgi:diguanylate cyclase (GGDEF)-like protein